MRDADFSENLGNLSLKVGIPSGLMLVLSVEPDLSLCQWVWKSIKKSVGW